MNYLAPYLSPLGPMTMASNGEALIGLWFDGQKYDRISLEEESVLDENQPVFKIVTNWLDCYFSGGNPDPLPPIRIVGSPFRRIVSDILLSVPYGQLTTYGTIAREAARRLGKENMSAQAVGVAVGHNPISIIVPCHRVIGSGNSLTGYAGGIKRKLRLLELEGHDIMDFVIPTKELALQD